MWYISLTKRWYKNSKHNEKINILQKIKTLSLSFCLGSPWVRSLLELRDSNLWGLLGRFGRILLFFHALILALESFRFFSFANILVGVHWSFQRSRRDLVHFGHLRHLGGLLKEIGDRIWELTNLWEIVDALRSLQARISRDLSNIKGLTPKNVVVVPSYSGELLYKSGLSLLNPKRVRSLLLGLDCLFKKLGSLPSLAKFFVKICHQLFLYCHVYFSVVQLLLNIFKLFHYCL